MKAVSVSNVEGTCYEPQVLRCGWVGWDVVKVQKAVGLDQAALAYDSIWPHFCCERKRKLRCGF